jgi:hypothetical protein
MRREEKEKEEEIEAQISAHFREREARQYRKWAGVEGCRLQVCRSSWLAQPRPWP